MQLYDASGVLAGKWSAATDTFENGTIMLLLTRIEGNVETSKDEISAQHMYNKKRKPTSSNTFISYAHPSFSSAEHGSMPDIHAYPMNTRLELNHHVPSLRTK